MKHLPNLLIVDDDINQLNYIKTILKGMNLNLVQALSGMEALEKINGLELALAVIDIRMPGMDGFELAKALGKERPDGKIPIIFLTGDLYVESKIYEGYSSGAVDFIYKPVDDKILRSKIMVFLDLFNQRQKIIRNAAQLNKYANELTRVNASLKTSEEKYKNYIECAPDGVFIADENGKYIEVNEAACRITGYSRDELVKMSISDILPEESQEDSLAYFRKVIKTGASKIDVLFKHKNGSLRWWSVESVKLSETRFLGFAKDITHRKETEEVIRRQQSKLELQNDELSKALVKAEFASDKYSELYNFAPVGYFTLSPEQTIQEVNKSGARMLGKERAQLIGSQFGFFVSKNSLPVLNTFLLNVFNGKTKEICELMLETNSMNPLYLHIEGISINNGKQCLMNVADITNRTQIEKALQFSEEKYRTILNASPDGIFLTDLKGIITEVSEIGLELFGADVRDDLVGKHFFRFVPLEEKNTIKEIFEKTMNEGLAQNVELKIRKKNKTIFPSETSATLIQSSDGVPLSFMIIIRDISQRKKIETKQLHADRMANLGEMASGIAHEINQPLNIISIVMDKLLFESAKTESIDLKFLKTKADKIFENIIRMRNIIDHIRAFSRNQDDYIQTAFDLNSSIENATSMLTEQFKHFGIKLDFKLDKQIPQLLGNTYKFEQVILNLLGNAKDAVIEKKSKQEESFKMRVGIRSYQKNQSIIVEVTDNGIGISNDDFHNIMLPFYTTKDAGKGTGLGLSICYQIIKEMGGTIDITSDELNGTKVLITLDLQMKM